MQHMSTVGPVNDSNVLAQSAIVPQPLLVADTKLERTDTYFELDNAAILAASIGLGIHIDTFA